MNAPEPAPDSPEWPEWDAQHCPEDRTGFLFAAWKQRNPLHKISVGRIANKNITALRVNEIINWTRRGTGTGSAARKASALWGLSRRHMDDLQARANRQMVADLSMDREVFAARLIAQGEYITEAAMEGKQYSAAVGALALLARVTSVVPKSSGSRY